MNEKICRCGCHNDEKTVMHCFPCCNFSYRKYINKDGTIDIERIKKLRMDHDKSN